MHWRAKSVLAIKCKMKSWPSVVLTCDTWRGEEKDDTFDDIYHCLDIQQIDESSMIIEFISWMPCQKIFSCRATISFFTEGPSPSLWKSPEIFPTRTTPRPPYPLITLWGMYIIYSNTRTWDPIFSKSLIIITSKVSSFSSPLHMILHTHMEYI